MLNKCRQFSTWFKTRLGAALLRAEKRALLPYWSERLGEYLLLLGNAHQAALVDPEVVKNVILASPCVDDPVPGIYRVYAEAEELPIEPGSIDVVLLPHTLEFATDPYQVLRDVEITLRPEGRLILLGFNPYSLWGLRHLFSRKKQGPWCGCFRGAFRVKDWLNVLGFEIVGQKRFFYRPPIKQRAIFKSFYFLEILGRFLWAFFGGVYIVDARKKVLGMTPLRLRWRRLAPQLSNGVFPRPAMRTMKND